MEGRDEQAAGAGFDGDVAEGGQREAVVGLEVVQQAPLAAVGQDLVVDRSEEHTSEIQSHLNFVFRLLLEKKKKIQLAPCIIGRNFYLFVTSRRRLHFG